MNYLVIIVLMLAGFCLLPLVAGYVITLFPSKSTAAENLVVGNALLAGSELPAHVPPVLQPMVHLIRTHGDNDMKAFVQGLRHFPIQETAGLLQSFLLRSDPLVQIYAQSILQEKQERLQRAFVQPADLSTEAELANYMEAGLGLMASPLTPLAEHLAILSRLVPFVDEVVEGQSLHPRLLYVSARVSLLARRLDVARHLHDLLPSGSPLQEDVKQRLSHQEGISRSQSIQ